MPARIALFVLVFLIVLNPYTVWGRPGIAASLLLAGYAMFRGLNAQWAKKAFLLLGMMFLISLWGAWMSVMHGIGQLTHPYTVFSLMVVMFAAYGLWLYCQSRNISLDFVLACILFSIVANGLIALSEVASPDLRALIESYLIETGNIDFTKGFRFRGIAASGGAGLSITIPVAMLISVYLFQKGTIGLLLFMFSVATLFASGLVIGRTGLVLLPFAVLFYVLMNLQRLFSIKRISYSLLILLLLASIAPFFYGAISEYLTGRIGPGFMNYAFGFLLRGEEGVKDEGTISVIGQFLTVLPMGFPEVITGYGFYGGSDFIPWTDSGYARMFLSVGFPLGLLFYVCTLYLFAPRNVEERVLLWPILLVLLLAEAKEPLLISGYGSRMFLLILVFVQLKRMNEKVQP